MDIAHVLQWHLQVPAQGGTPAPPLPTYSFAARSPMKQTNKRTNTETNKQTRHEALTLQSKVGLLQSCGCLCQRIVNLVNLPQGHGNDF